MAVTMRKEIDGVKNEMKDLKAMFRRTMVHVVRMSSDIAELKDKMATKDDISMLMGRMDGFSGLLLDSRQRWAVHADVLKQHDDRLTKIEKRPS
jgi:hypothetical protein